MSIDELENIPFEPSQKYVCKDCVSDEWLKNHIKETGLKRICSYCQKHKNVISINEILERLNDYIGFFYLAPVECAPYNSREGGYLGWDGYCFSDLLYGNLDYDDKPYDDICSAFDHRLSDALIEYGIWTEPTEEQLLKYSYSNFKTIVKDNKDFSAMENNIYDNDDRETIPPIKFLSFLEEKLYKINTKIIETSPPKSKIFRARLMEGVSFELNSQELGLPIKMNVGRLNQNGEYCFYGASCETTAFREINATSSTPVAVGIWELKKELKLLNLTFMENCDGKYKIPYISIYDTENLWKIRVYKFFKNFLEDFHKPICDQNEYRTTQAISQYFKNLSREKFDGIIYNSSKGYGYCYALFLEHDKSTNKYSQKQSEVLSLIKSRVYDRPETRSIEETLFNELNKS